MENVFFSISTGFELNQLWKCVAVELLNKEKNQVFTLWFPFDRDFMRIQFSSR